MSETRADVVVAGHTCLDIIPSLDTMTGRAEEMFAPGTLVKVGPATVATGGACPNTGLALHRLNVATRLMGKLGDDLFGRAVVDILKGFAPSLAEDMIVAAGEHTSYSVVISPPATDRTFVHHTGANDTFAADDVPYERVAGTRIFHFGYPPLMHRMYADGGQELSRLLSAARERGPAVSMDMSQPDPDSDAGRADWPAILQRALRHVDLFMPSLDETLFMLDRETFKALHDRAGGSNIAALANGRLLARLASELIDMGAAIVAIKLGDQGLYLRTTSDGGRLAAVGGQLNLPAADWLGRELLSPCFHVEVGGTTGAGDSTVAGLLAGLLHGLGPQEAMRAAVGVGACSVEQPDATSGIPAWDVVEQRIAAGWAQREAGLDLAGWQVDEGRGLLRGPSDRA